MGRREGRRGGGRTKEQVVTEAEWLMRQRRGRRGFFRGCEVAAALLNESFRQW